MRLAQRLERVRETVSQVLAAAGYFEAVTFTFTSRDHATRLRPSDLAAEPLLCRGTALRFASRWRRGSSNRSP